MSQIGGRTHYATKEELGKMTAYFSENTEKWSTSA